MPVRARMKKPISTPPPPTDIWIRENQTDKHRNAPLDLSVSVVRGMAFTFFCCCCASVMNYCRIGKKNHSAGFLSETQRVKHEWRWEELKNQNENSTRIMNKIFSAPATSFRILFIIFLFSYQFKCWADHGVSVCVCVVCCVCGTDRPIDRPTSVCSFIILSYTHNCSMIRKHLRIPRQVHNCSMREYHCF